MEDSPHDFVVTVETPPVATRVARCSRLLAVCRLAAGHDDVAIADLTAHDIGYVNAPLAMAEPVANAGVTLVLACLLHLPIRERLAREGGIGWYRASTLLGRDPRGRVLGVVGPGRIGAGIIARARVLGMKPRAFSPNGRIRSDAGGFVEMVGLDEVVRSADVLVLACPLNDSTRGLLSRDRIFQMKRGAIVVNVGRGALIDEDALADALEDGLIGGAGLDVTTLEPLPDEHRLSHAPNVILTAHSLCLTDRCYADALDEVLGAITTLRGGTWPESLVNSDVALRPEWRAKWAAFSTGVG